MSRPGPGATPPAYPAAVPTSPSPVLRRLLPALLVVVALVGAACGADDDSGAAPTTTATTAPTTTGAGGEDAGDAEPGPPPVAEAGTYAVGAVEDTVVDDTRPTQAHGDEPELPERTLPVLVLYPAEGPPPTDGDGGEAVPDAAPAPGPWPLVVFSHGLGGTGPAYTATLRAWASAGYVVVAPTYPLANPGTPGGPTPADIPAQVADVSALVDWALDAGAADEAPLAGLVDGDRVGIGGHSLGAFTSLGVGFNPCCRDPRVAAVTAWAGGYLPGLGDGGDPVADGPPLLVVHGDADATVGFDQAEAVLDAVPTRRALLRLVDGPHTPPFVQGLGEPTSALVTSAALAFFDEHLKDDPTAADRLEALVAEAGPDVATLQVAG